MQIRVRYQSGDLYRAFILPLHTDKARKYLFNDEALQLAI
jgi:hypothetical protein